MKSQIRTIAIVVFALLIGFNFANAKRIVTSKTTYPWAHSISVDTQNYGEVSGPFVTEENWYDDETGESGTTYYLLGGNQGPGRLEYVRDRDGCSEWNFYPDKRRMSLNEESDESLIKTWPNPVSNELHVSVNLPERTPANLEIYNQNGQKVFSGPISNLCGESINTSDMASGIYLVVFDIAGYKQTEKITIVK